VELLLPLLGTMTKVPLDGGWAEPNAGGEYGSVFGPYAGCEATARCSARRAARVSFARAAVVAIPPVIPATARTLATPVATRARAAG
jgi:hypothetical protein